MDTISYAKPTIGNYRPMLPDSMSDFGSNLLKLIDAVGTQSFLHDMLRFINRLCGANHCSFFRIDGDNVCQLGSHSLDGGQVAQRNLERYMKLAVWRGDPAMLEARRLIGSAENQSIIHVGLSNFSSDVRTRIYRDISDRILLCGSRHRAGYCLSLVRSKRNGCFEQDDTDRLSDVSEALQSLILKHAEVLARQPDRSLTSLEEIETSILHDGKLSVREAQVCARILYGLSSAGIALDLGIGEETVKTYRSRAYQRLGIGSPREMMVWYLSIWQPVMGLQLRPVLTS